MNGSWRFYIVFILLAGAALYITLHADLTVPTNKPFSQFPVQQNGWQMISEYQFSDTVMDVLKPTDYISRLYAAPDGTKVTLYIGYHGGGEGGGEIHSPKHCLPGSGWFEVSTRREPLPVGAETLNMVRSVYRKGENKEMFLYWFQVRDRSLDNEYSLKIAEITGSLLYRRRDASFIRISVPFTGDEAAARKTGEQFIRDFYPAVRSFLPV